MPTDEQNCPSCAYDLQLERQRNEQTVANTHSVLKASAVGADRQEVIGETPREALDVPKTAASESGRKCALQLPLCSHFRGVKDQQNAQRSSKQLLDPETLIPESYSGQLSVHLLQILKKEKRKSPPQDSHQPSPVVVKEL